MLKNPKEEAAQWRQTARQTLETAKHLRDREDCRSCVSRAYYAAYQAATSVCVSHGDAASFPASWNNPSHENLPELLFNNGDLPLDARRRLRKILLDLRSKREDADYRMRSIVNAQSVVDALKATQALFKLLEIEDADK